MLIRFSNEVLSRGASAVLPQNLSPFWLGVLQKYADDFLDANFAVNQCTEKLDMGDPVLVACVHEVIGGDPGAAAAISAETLAELTTIYALSLTMETIRREADMEMPLPTLENLLSIDRIVDFGKINPEFGRFLAKACIPSRDDMPAKENWFDRLKKKIRRRLA